MRIISLAREALAASLERVATRVRGRDRYAPNVEGTRMGNVTFSKQAEEMIAKPEPRAVDPLEAIESVIVDDRPLPGSYQWRMNQKGER